MARLEGTVPINMIDPTTYYGVVVEATSTRIVISDGYNSSVYSGYGFTYYENVVTGGTLTGYTQFQGQVPVGLVYDFSLPASFAATYIQSNNLPGLFQVALSGNDIILGSPYGDKLAGYDGNDIIIGGAGNDIIYGGAGNDILGGQSGINFIDGGPGVDYASYDGPSSAYRFLLWADGTIEVQDYFNQLHDTLVSVERLMFTDGAWALDIEGNAGQAFRLYQAAFDREPDIDGLSYWIGRLDSGTTTLNAVADSFIHSPEFIRTYGTTETVSNARYVELLYNHTLGRVSDQEGFNYWVNKLDTGQTNRGDLLAFFSESDENFARTEPAIHDGIWFYA